MCSREGPKERAAFQIETPPRMLPIVSVGVHNALQTPPERFMPQSGEVETVEVHHLGPRRYKVAYELLP